MIRATLLTCLLALPAQVQAQAMTQELCRLGWEALNTLIDEDKDMIAAVPDVTPDGLCRIDTSNAPLQQNDFESVEWQATGVAEAVAEQGMPLSLTASFTGIDPVYGLKLPLDEAYDGPLGTMQLAFSRDAVTRDAALQDWTTDFGPLGRISFRARGGGIDLGSLKAMQFTSGGLRIYELAMDLSTTAPLSKALLADLPQDTALALVDGLSEGALNPESRDALRLFLRAGPEAVGRLTLSAHSEAGVGFLQMVGALRPMEEAGPTAPALSEGLGILLDGVSLRATWTPET
ncbi:hypothetical protein EI983_05155 [Roseovarius faecimaris]|uniref:DUF2125 domain-containing protein n=1 Tax=Roseovarius faecimaris TaxID=2494550 RepID=A0A6I6IPG9_9RHOB|nr:hypothetical protein [Roseovarius faecimaris]QGX97701.1 hypothetical protein EI983_05155 [Roseovarius faecimaris]